MKGSLTNEEVRDSLDRPNAVEREADMTGPLAGSLDTVSRRAQHVEVYDRPMCCPTGMCGPSIDPVLAQFAADLEWLRTQGVQVDRFNLTQQPSEFTRQADVVQQLQTAGVASLPIVRVNGRIVSQSVYPTREQLAAWSDIRLSPSDPLTVLQKPCCSS